MEFKPMTSTIPVLYALPTELIEASLEAGQVRVQFIPVILKRMTWCVYDKDHMSALRMGV